MSSFQSTPSFADGDWSAGRTFYNGLLFQSTPSFADGDGGVPAAYSRFCLISIHAVLRGRRPTRPKKTKQSSLFQSTPSFADGDHSIGVLSLRNPHFNPRRPSRTATHFSLHPRWDFLISIHAVLRGRRQDGDNIKLRIMVISIHAVLRGRRQQIGRKTILFFLFIKAYLPGNDKCNENQPVRVALLCSGIT